MHDATFLPLAELTQINNFLNIFLRGVLNHKGNIKKSDKECILKMTSCFDMAVVQRVQLTETLNK